MKIYIAAPLFNEMELERNRRISELLESLGYETYLPQRDGGCVSKIVKETGLEKEYVEENIFNMDISALDECDELLILLDGAVLDDGSCFELGYMFANHKLCNGYKTDVRASYDEKMNLMIDKSLKYIFTDKEEMKKYYQERKNNGESN